MFSVHTKTQSSVFKFRRFQIPPFSNSSIFKFLHFEIPPFSNSPVFKFPRFQIPPFSNSSVFKSVFEKLSFGFLRISVDGRPNWRNKAPFSNFSSAVWTALKPGKSEDGAFTLKTHQMFSFHIAPGKLKTQQTLAVLDLFSRKTRAEKSHDNPNAIVSVKLRF